MSQHFLQSPAWQNFQTEIDRETFRQSGDGWEYMAVLEKGTLNTRLYTPYGPTLSDATRLKSALDSLIQLGKQRGVTFVRVEPVDPSLKPELKKLGWLPVNYQQLQPEHTSLIDLTQPQSELISNMSQPVRNIYRNYHKKDLVIHQSNKPDDIDIFLKFIHQTAQRTGMQPHSDEYFRSQAKSLFPANNASLWYATLYDQPIAAAIFYSDSTTRYYAHAGASSSPEHRRLNAPTALLAAAIIDAQNQGLKSFDLYGISPDNSPKDHPWQGFTKFKRSFGGSDAEFAGAWDFPLKPISYRLYRAYQKLR